MHAPLLAEVPGAELVAVCDTDRARARHLAEQQGIPHVFTSSEEALASGLFEFAHVLVPPHLHADLAGEMIDAGIGVLIEKPMAPSGADCRAITDRAKERGVQLGVNHNSLFYPAYLKLRDAVLEASFGPLQHLVVVVNRPAHWLTHAGAWLHERPEHNAYESAIHPLAQVYDLAGGLVSVASVASDRRELEGGLHIFRNWHASFVCERATAQLSLTYGHFPTYQLLAVCDDGVLSAEVEANRFTAIDRTRWTRTRFGRGLQPLRVARKGVAHELGYGFQNVLREAGWNRSVARSNIYLTSMLGSMGAFHRGARPEQPVVDGEFGTQVISMCDEMTRGLNGRSSPSRRSGRRAPIDSPDALIVGGTGFIGRSVVEQMTSDGMTVRVLARHCAGLPPLFGRPEIELVQGDVTDEATLNAAVRGARAVVHLADSRDRVTWQTLDSVVTEEARILARACAREGVQQLVCTGAFTSLDLGDPAVTITGSTRIDPGVSTGSAYEFSKARLEEVLRELAGGESLPLCIVRPGIVVGSGGNPFHPGFGVWRGDTHCVGWNGGNNPLPLVLASDVAKAIMLAVCSPRSSPRSYNLVGDVALSARECVAEMRSATKRPLVFHPAHPAQHWGLAVAKAGARKVVGRRGAPSPSYRLFVSKGCWSRFDCSDVRRDLGWHPVAARGEFVKQAFHGASRSPDADART
jgi:predicted dehydrogenase/nucleoside-diphosphate-sugar epimerase